jgi:Uma2 family endonuclease
MHQRALEKQPSSATMEDLFRIAGDRKAEIIDGKVVILLATGHLPGRAAGNVYLALRIHERISGVGIAMTDNLAFRCDLRNRGSFSPDAAYYTGPVPNEMSYYPEAPAFAVEVRSENDYGAAADRDIATKREDYFAAGTMVVWDVDLLGTDVVRKYSADNPGVPAVFRRGEIADAEPAVPGWTMPVDDLFA